MIEHKIVMRSLHEIDDNFVFFVLQHRMEADLFNPTILHICRTDLWKKLSFHFESIRYIEYSFDVKINEIF